MSLAFLLQLGLLGCAADPDAVVRVDAIDRRDPHEMASQPFELGVLEKRAAGAIVPTLIPGFRFRAARPGDGTWQLEILLTMFVERTSDSDEKKLRRALGLTTSLRALSVDKGAKRRLPSPIAVETLHTQDVSPGVEIEGFVVEAIDRAMRGLGQAVRLHRASEAAVVESLASGDASARALAIDVAGERRLANAVPSLGEIVRSDQEESNILRAVGALVRIGDPSAVEALIDGARQRPPAYLVQILFAVSALGGAEAEAYLFTVASGHQDPGVRSAAGQALRETVARREGASSEP